MKLANGLSSFSFYGHPAVLWLTHGPAIFNFWVTTLVIGVLQILAHLRGSIPSPSQPPTACYLSIPQPFGAGPRKAAFLAVFVSFRHVTYPHVEGSGTAHDPSPVTVMSGPLLFGFISFVAAAPGFPPAAQRVMDGPTNVAQSHRHLQALFSARWLRVYPKPLGRVDPPYMALAYGPSGHPAWVQMAAEMQPPPSITPNPFAPHILSEPTSAYRRCPSMYQSREIRPPLTRPSPPFICPPRGLNPVTSPSSYTSTPPSGTLQ